MAGKNTQWGSESHSTSSAPVWRAKTHSGDQNHILRRQLLYSGQKHTVGIRITFYVISSCMAGKNTQWGSESHSTSSAPV